jgi:cell wall-associated NlpC family hydrolase
MSDASFFTAYLDDAKQAAGLTGVQVSVILSQWADETGYGTSLAFISGHNFAGVSYGGVASFPTVQAGLSAYIETLNQHNFDNVRQSHGYRSQCYSLGAGPPPHDGQGAWAQSGYDATNYKKGVPFAQLDFGVDLTSIIEANNLTRYDAPGQNSFESIQNGLPGPIDPALTDNAQAPVSSLGPPQLPPPPGLESSVASDVFILNGSQMDANVSGSLINISLSLDITQASTLIMELHDPQQQLINLSVFQEASVLNLGGNLYELVAVEKQASTLSLTFELWVIAALRKATGPFSIQPGEMSRTDFAALLVGNVQGAVFVQAPQTYLYSLDQGYGQASGLQEQLSRGTIDDPLESSWTCLQRISAEIQWRCFAVNNAVYFGPDSWLMSQPPVAALQKGVGGVLDIDGTWDAGQPLGTVEVTALAGTWLPYPGTVCTVSNLGVFDGPWLVQTIDREALSQPDITITLCQPGPALHEPASGGAQPATGQQSTAGSSAAQAALTAAESQLGKPYVWADENPQTGFDCSGLMQWSYAQAGISITRSTYTQFPAGPAVPAGITNLLPGDLVFFGAAGVAQHVGMFVSSDAATNTATMIDAPHNGAVVRYDTFTPTVGTNYGADVYMGATRPAP